jgi:tRNA threonylcarbamoyl adenosine modification protein YjeE
MLASNTPRMTWDIVLPDEDATRRFAIDVAAALKPGDLVTLSGDLGAGKTTLARAIIRALGADEAIEVPSPTFTLLQIYDLPRFPVVHADLYRVNTLAELAELGWEEASEGAAVLVEWPDRAGALIQADRLEIALTMANDLGPGYRQIGLTGLGVWADRLARLRAARELIDSAGYGSALRRHLQGDASSRSYERLFSGASPAILMNSPPRPDGPALRDGKSYSDIAHLAENVRPFVALSRALRGRGFSAPEIFAADLETGFLLIEDLGSEGVAAGDPPAPVEERYAAAIDVLVALHNSDFPAVLPVAPRIEHELPPYDLEAFLVEVELILDWYLPLRGVTSSPAPLREYFLGLWRTVLNDIVQAPGTWVLRDFHSPNLLWLPEREGIARVGLLDFQDAVMGPPAYDVASLLMDARVDVSEELELRLLSRYAIGRKAANPDFDLDEFVRCYRTLGAQRATKILGIFARLNKRDNKPQYLAHLPRVWSYLARALAHPSLAKLKTWYEANVPPPADAALVPTTQNNP